MRQEKLYSFVGKVKVRVLKDVPFEFVGGDMKIYPKLKVNDVLLMDKETAELLEKNGVVKIIE